ncbi:MAG: hypothetical protein ACTS73_04170 [Arsenophonus sp. NEOnobi-MAG3]
MLRLKCLRSGIASPMEYSLIAHCYTPYLKRVKKVEDLLPYL